MIEKQRFYISEFEQEAAWLAFMHREGWRFTSKEKCYYHFEPCEKEDWCYQLDFKESQSEDEDYIQIYKDYGWEYVLHSGNWFYFRKKKEEGKEEDFSIFSDKESKIEMCRRIINGQFSKVLPLYAIILVYNYLVFFTNFLQAGGFLGGLIMGIAMAAVLMAVAGLGFYIGQVSRLSHIAQKIENPVK